MPEQNLAIANTTRATPANSHEGIDPLVFSHIYAEQYNMVVWRRNLTANLNLGVAQLLQIDSNFKKAIIVKPEEVVDKLMLEFPKAAFARPLFEDMAELADMFACLFELDYVGLRLSAMQQPMCPKFHVDQVPCRLISTYQGAATQWLANDSIERDQLKIKGFEPQTIQALTTGDVALLKGEKWQGNENLGLVHRSPEQKPNCSRLLFTLDFA